MHPLVRALLLVACGVAAAAQPVRGRLPLESFTAAQGLANDAVTSVRSDSRGFLWFTTLDGLSRYDGTRFVNYTTDDGLPDRMVWAVTEGRDNAMWVGTAEGIVRMSATAPRGEDLFTPVRSQDGVAADGLHVFEDEGTIWASCGADLCRTRGGMFEVDVTYRALHAGNPGPMTRSPSGELWVATGNGVARRDRRGVWHRFGVQPVDGNDGVGGIVFDLEGRAWISTGWGFFVYTPVADDRDPRPLVERAGEPILPGQTLRMPDPGGAVMITASYPTAIVCRVPVRARDGSIWQPCYAGLFHVAGGRVEYFDGSDGLPLDITSVAEDPLGDLWISTRGAGALRLAKDGATTWTRAHGLANQRIVSLFSLDDGSVCAVDRVALSCFGQGKITHGSIWPPNAPPGWGWNQVLARDPDGRLWAASGKGLIRSSPVRTIDDLPHAAATNVYTTSDGLDWNEVFRVWRDSRGGLWAGTFGRRMLSRLEPGASRFTSYGKEEGISRTPTAFAEDRAGNVWLGFYDGGLARVRGRAVENIGGPIPSGLVRALFVDSSGGLWVGTGNGITRIADPTAPATKLAFRAYGRRDGLASDAGYCFAELGDHRIAIGSQRGLDVLDPASGSVVHLSMREGLASNEVSVAMVDRQGALWLGTINGLSRLTRVPAPRFAPPPRLRIDEILIDGTPVAVAELGAMVVDDLRIEYPQHSMMVRFRSPHYDPSRPLRFEYRLGAGGSWTNAGTQRAIVFDRLPAGAGILEIRAVAANGRTSEPARVSFLVVPPVWKRTWFLALCVATLALTAFAAHRARLAQAVALERVRTRAATDLHDDLGSSLSRISILSEVAKRRLAEETTEPILDEIADSARGLVDALGDSIWSIDPQLDDVRSLLQRVRQFASALFEQQSIALDVQVAPDVASLALRPEQRRETYLILKEALNNAAKHAGARSVVLSAAAEGRYLRVSVKDNGRGFEVSSVQSLDEGGRGVPSMSERARRAGGRLEIHSRPGAGTTVSVAVPL